MAVKWLALAVAVFATIVVAAGGGAYWAVRDNRSTVENADGVRADGARNGLAGIADRSLADAIQPTVGTAAAVDATEEDIRQTGPGAETTASSDNASVPSRETLTAARGTPPAAVPRVESPTLATPAPRTEPTAAAVPTGAPPRSARPATTPASTREEPTPAATGWTRAQPSDTPSTQIDNTRADASTIPDRVAIGRMDPAAVGVSLAPEPRPRRVEELVIPADSVIGLQVDTSVSTDDAEIEDTVEARVTRDVMVGDQVAISAGSQVFGSVVLVERAGQFKGASRLGVRFHTVVLDDIAELAVATETVYREGEGQGKKSAAKIGGAAIGGAVLGAIFGGRQGAAIGSAAGAASGTAVAMTGDGDPATLRAGSPLTVRLSRPATVTIAY